MSFEDWVRASKPGAIAGVIAISGGEQLRYSPVAHIWSDWYGTRGQFVGTPIHRGVKVVSGSVPGLRGLLESVEQDGKIVDALVVNTLQEIMKYCTLIKNGARWTESDRLRQTPLKLEGFHADHRPGRNWLW